MASIETQNPREPTPKEKQLIEEVVDDFTHLTFRSRKDSCSWKDTILGRFVEKQTPEQISQGKLPQRVYSLFICCFDTKKNKFVQDGLAVNVWEKDEKAVNAEKHFIESPQFRIDLILHESDGWTPRQKKVKEQIVEGYLPMLDQLRATLYDLLFLQDFLYVWRVKPDRSLMDVVEKIDPMGFESERPHPERQIMPFQERVAYAQQCQSESQPTLLHKPNDSQVLVTKDNDKFSIFKALFHENDGVILIRQDDSGKTKDCIFFQREDGKWSYVEMRVCEKFSESVSPTDFFDHNCRIPMDADKWPMNINDSLEEYANVFIKQQNFVILFPQDTKGVDQLKKLKRTPNCSYLFREEREKEIHISPKRSKIC